MKKAALRLTSLAAGCASLFALAAVDVTPLTQATAALNDCAAIANAIAAVPVPPDAAKAALKQATNETITDAKQKLATDPAEDAFAAQMKDGAAKFDACGKNVREKNGAANDFIKTLGAAKVEGDDANVIKTAYEAYEKARDNMKAAVIALTSDHVRASYMRTALHAHFLQAPSPSSGQGPRRAQQ